LILKFESFTQNGCPSAFTFFVPFAVSDDIATFGYGIGTGPAGDGVLQTSGNASVTPLLCACTSVSLFAPTVTGMTNPSGNWGQSPFSSTNTFPPQSRQRKMGSDPNFPLPASTSIAARWPPS